METESSKVPFVLQEKVNGNSLETIAYAISVTQTEALKILIEGLEGCTDNQITPDQHRTLELLRLDYLWRKLEAGIDNGDVQAIKTANTISARRSALLGIDNDVRTQVNRAIETYVSRILTAAQESLDPASYKILRKAILASSPTSVRRSA